MNAKKVFLKMRSFWTEIKVYLIRANSYIVIVNMGMLIFIVLSRLKDFGININLTKFFLPIFFGSLVVAILVGLVDYKLGFHQEEQDRMSKRNPLLLSIWKDVKEIKQKMK